MLYLIGDWAGAQREFEAALRIGKSAEPALYGEALARLAELRLAQGRLEEVERLLDGFEDHVTSACVLARLRLARGDPAAAARILRRRQREIGEHERERTSSYHAGAEFCLEEAALLELLSRAELEQGDIDAASATARRLAERAAVAGCEVIIARGERALGRMLAAIGEATEALVHLERALSGFSRLKMPFEAARTRLLLARTLDGTDRGSAVAEARAALAAFEELGAADADAAAGLLRSLGVRGPHRSPGHGDTKQP